METMAKRGLVGILLLACAAAAVACGRAGSETTPRPGGTPVLKAVTLAPNEKLAVVATTSIVGDIVRQVGGEHVEVHTLLGTGTDPHSFEPTPRDVAAVSDAAVVFANGAGLEEFLDKLLANAGEGTPVVSVSDGIELRDLSADHLAQGGEHADAQNGKDPHTWTSPANALIFVDNIVHALQTLDPAHAQDYAANAQAYRRELEQMDRWIAAQVATIPVEQRLLVTDHLVLGYYADRYGFKQVGALVEAFSSGASPSAKELAALEDTIRSLGVKAVFVGASANPALAERVAADTGVKLATLYTGSLGPAGSGADTYLGYLRYNTETIVAALR